jgi:hypothetical protein
VRDKNIPDTLHGRLRTVVGAAGKQWKPQCCTLRGAKRLLKRNIILKRKDYHFADASKMIFGSFYLFTFLS